MPIQPKSKPQSVQTQIGVHRCQIQVGFSTGTASSGSNVRGNNEETFFNGNPSVNDAPAVNTSPPDHTTIEPSCTATRIPNTATMGKPKPMDSVPILNHKNEKDQKNTKKTKKDVNVSSWNIRRGLVIREQELKEIIKGNSINIIF